MSWLRTIYNFLYEIFFGCGHGNLTRPFTLQAYSYKVCLDCGKQFPYSAEQMRPLHAREVARTKPQLTELIPVTLAAGFSEDEDYRHSEAVA